MVKNASPTHTRAMILAAGKGERMGELTRACPKPLLLVRGQPLISYHVRKLAAIGIQDCVINLRYLGEQIQETLGDGEKFNIRIHYSYETEALETAGGIIQTLDFFEEKPFILISGDVLCDYPLEEFLLQAALLEKNESSILAHLVMVANPSHHREGDFALRQDGLLGLEGEKLNYAGMGVYHPKLFSDYPSGYRKLGDVMKAAISQRKITAEYYSGKWLNVDTPERLELAQRF